MAHKWAKEIHAWADGAEIQHRLGDCWRDCEKPAWGEQTEYRIKPQPKEPQYLYVFQTEGKIELALANSITRVKTFNAKFKYIGKIKLEDE